MWKHHRRSLQGTEGRHVYALFISSNYHLVCKMRRTMTNPCNFVVPILTFHLSPFLSSLHQFRLKRCGLRRPCYLVEECGTAASHLSLPETTLQQAIVNTQVRRTHTTTLNCLFNLDIIDIC